MFFTFPCICMNSLKFISFKIFLFLKTILLLIFIFEEHMNVVYFTFSRCVKIGKTKDSCINTFTG